MQLTLTFDPIETSDALQEFQRNRKDLLAAQSDLATIKARIKLLTEEGEHVKARLAALVTEAEARQRAEDFDPLASEDAPAESAPERKPRKAHIAREGSDPTPRPALSEAAIDADFSAVEGEAVLA